MNRTIINSLIVGLLGGSIAACGGGASPGAVAPQMAVAASTTVCFPAWISTFAYRGGGTASFAGVNYTAA